MQRVSSPPLGLPPLARTISAAEVALGRTLFFDLRLSRDGDLSCASCHIPAHAFADNRTPTATGAGGRRLRRNAPTLLNVAYALSLFHDGRAGSLEEQVVGPLFAPDEMANATPEELVARLAGLQDYSGRFERAFGGGATMERIARAIAAFERTLISGNSPFDRWRFGGESDAMSDPAKRGFVLFTGRAGCAECHRIGDREALFTDHEFHFIGTGYRAVVARIEETRSARVVTAVFAAGDAPAAPPAPVDLGRQEATDDPADQSRYRTPSLRNVALTAPYMHDGSFATLEDVVRYYNYTGIWHARLDARIRPLGLLKEEIAALVAFLESLTGDNIAALLAEAPTVSGSP
jgi:cytochrome c peroxidase